MSDKTMTVIGVKDMWNATNERTIDGRDVVLVQVTEDGKMHVEEMSVQQFRTDAQFQDKYGDESDRMTALEGMKQFSFDNRPVTMSLSAQDNADRYAKGDRQRHFEERRKARLGHSSLQIACKN